MELKRITQFNKKTLDGLNMLLLQWSNKGYQMSPQYFKKLIKKSHILCFYHKNRIIGTVTLVEVYKLSGFKGSIEHLMIDQAYRGRGFGEKLMRYAINYAKRLKMETLFLTCEPYRKAANSLYRKLKFNIIPENFYILKL